jgi:hypothetical protein
VHGCYVGQAVVLRHAFHDSREGRRQRADALRVDDNEMQSWFDDVQALMLLTHRFAAAIYKHGVSVRPRRGRRSTSDYLPT